MLASQTRLRRKCPSGILRFKFKRVLRLGQGCLGLAMCLLAFSVLSISCTGTRISPKEITPALKTYQHLAVGEIGVVDELWKGHLPFLRRGLKERLQKKGEFATILDPAPDTLPQNTLLVTGQVTNVKKGNQALRILIGFGAGAESISGDFALYDESGTQLGAFQSQKSYAGGLGIGGADLMEMDDLMQKLGEETADAIIRWTKGKPLLPPSTEPSTTDVSD